MSNVVTERYRADEGIPLHVRPLMVDASNGSALRVGRELRAEPVDLVAYLGRDLLVVGRAQNPPDQRRDRLHLGRTHARGRDRSSAEPETTRDEGLLRVVRDRVLVAGNARRCRALPARPCRSRRTGADRRASRGCRCRPKRCGSPRPRGPWRVRRRWSRSRPRTVRNDGWLASRNATAFAAITCMSGPPWSPGNTALSMAAAYCFAAQDRTAARTAQRLVRGERDDVGVREPATGARRRRSAPRCARRRRAGCASTSSAMARNASKSMMREYAVAPAMIRRGRSRTARSRISS